MAGKKTGRPRKPTATLRLHGTFRADRRYASEPAPETAIPNRPKFLKGEAKKEWLRITKLLQKQKCLTECDRALLAAYCLEWGVYAQLARRVTSIDDYVSVSEKGNEFLNPLVTARNRSLKNLSALAVEFGLSPSSRTRISTNPAAEQSDQFGALLQRQRRSNAG